MAEIEKENLEKGESRVKERFFVVIPSVRLVECGVWPLPVSNPIVVNVTASISTTAEVAWRPTSQSINVKFAPCHAQPNRSDEHVRDLAAFFLNIQYGLSKVGVYQLWIDVYLSRFYFAFFQN